MAKQGEIKALFAPLREYLAARDDDECALTFAQIEALIGAPIPLPFRTHTRRWTAKDTTHVRLLRDAGWYARLRHSERRVIFRRIDAMDRGGEGGTG
jgi:hypothetical protein